MQTTNTNTALELLALLNDGANHNFTFELEGLPAAISLESSLGAYFSSIVNWRTGLTHSPEEWSIKTVLISESIHNALGEALEKWVFGMEFSPIIRPEREWVKNTVVEFVCDKIVQDIGEATVHEVIISPPVWYEAHWQDFAFSSKTGYWLLHLGVTD